jgi:hypothetical protein
MSVCDDEFVSVLHNKLLFINRRWKEITESVQQFKHDDLVKKKRDEFYSGRAKLLDTLDKIDREMQDYLPCTTKALKEQENRLYVRINVSKKVFVSQVYFRMHKLNWICLIKQFKFFQS